MKKIKLTQEKFAIVDDNDFKNIEDAIKARKDFVQKNYKEFTRKN